MSRRVVMVVVAVLAAGAVALWRASDVRGPLRSGLSQSLSSATSTAGTQVRADRRLLWVQPPEDTALDSLRLRASDWSGNEMGAVSLHCLAPCTVDASPDGQRLLVRPEGMRLVELAGGSLSLTLQPATVFDSSGTVVGTVASVAGDYSSSWADDSRHLCVLSDASGSPASVTIPELDLMDAGNGGRRPVTVATAQMTGSAAATAFESWNVVACSVISDRAVLAEDGPDGVGGVAVIKLSTGQLLYSRDDHRLGTVLGLFPIVAMTVSADGGLAVEQLINGSVRLRDLSTGATSLWPGGTENQPASVSSLSWHGLRAVTDRGVVDLTDGQIMWRPLLATPMSPEQDAQPGSDDVVVTVGGNEVVVRSDGSAVGLWAAYQPLGLPCSQLSSVMPLDRVIVLC